MQLRNGHGPVRFRPLLTALLLAASALAACSGPRPSAAPAFSMAPPVLPPEPATVYPTHLPSFTQTGLASWYGRHFHRKQTASGERYDMRDLTAAHPSLPIDTIVRVTNLTNDRSVLVRINDRGPFAPGRVIDLSRGAAELLGMKKAGVVPVRVEVFETDQLKNVAEFLRAW